jgi:hypothetical protein
MGYMTARALDGSKLLREPWRANRAPTGSLPISVIKFHQAIIVVAI